MSDYYRFTIYPRSTSDQHNTLVYLANANPINEVYYVAPWFSTFSDYKKYYIERNIVENSIFIDCRTLPIITESKSHVIAFRKDGKDLLLKSELIKIEGGCVDFREKERKAYSDLDGFIQSISERVDEKFDSIFEVQDYLLCKGIILQLWQKN